MLLSRNPDRLHLAKINPLVGNVLEAILHRIGPRIRVLFGGARGQSRDQVVLGRTAGQDLALIQIHRHRLGALGTNINTNHQSLGRAHV